MLHTTARNLEGSLAWPNSHDMYHYIPVLVELASMLHTFVSPDHTGTLKERNFTISPCPTESKRQNLHGHLAFAMSSINPGYRSDNIVELVCGHGWLLRGQGTTQYLFSVPKCLNVPRNSLFLQAPLGFLQFCHVLYCHIILAKGAYYLPGRHYIAVDWFIFYGFHWYTQGVGPC